MSTREAPQGDRARARRSSPVRGRLCWKSHAIGQEAGTRSVAPGALNARLAVESPRTPSTGLLCTPPTSKLRGTRLS